MSIDKSILHGKEKRRPYRKSKRFDSTCRNHGSCPWCRSNRLHKFAKSFLRGMASTIDIFGISYNDEMQEMLNRTDMDALASDWQAVGNDLYYAMGCVPIVEEEIENE